MAKWQAVITTVIFTVENLLRPLVRDTKNPIDDLGVEGILAILKAWQAKGVD